METQKQGGFLIAKIHQLSQRIFARILKGINDAISEYGYTAMTWENSESIEKEGYILKLLASYRVAGVLIVPASNLENDFNYDKLKTNNHEDYLLYLKEVIEKVLNGEINLSSAMELLNNNKT